MRYILLLFLLSIITASQAQITFNKRVQVGCINTAFYGLELTDSCYYLTGIARDSNNCILGNLFYKIDSFGDEISHKIHTRGLRFSTYNSSLQKDVDGSLVLAGFVEYNNLIKGLLIKYNTEGDTTWTREYNASTVPLSTHFRFFDLAVTADSSYLLVGTVYQVDSSYFVALQVERDGSRRWERAFRCPEGNCIKQTLSPLSDGFIVGYEYNNFTSNSPPRLLSFCKLKKMDYSGNVLWSWQSDSSLYLEGAKQIISTADKGLLVASAYGKEVLDTTFGITFIIHIGYVFKLDSARNWLWGRSLGNYGSHYENETSRIIEIEDSSLVCFSMSLDTIANNNIVFSQYNALITKLSPNGDSIWERQYQYFVQSNAEHKIFDVVQTPDKGFLACGHAVGTGQGPYQQGWLLKLDQHGCLVPGCHIDTTVVAILPRSAQPQAELKLYPNPVVDYLNVLYRNQQVGEKLTFRILDGQGRVLQTYKVSDVSNQTYVFPVWDLLAGWYVLEVRQDGVLVGSEVFVKG